MYKCKSCKAKFEQPLISNIQCDAGIEKVRCCPECGVIEQLEEEIQNA